jgi:RNA polymerase sigma factor (sigma-70 family)
MTVPDDDDFYVALWPRLVRVTYAVSGDLGVADAVQTAFAQAYRSRRRVSRLDAPEAYVRRMGVNEVLTILRRAHTRREVTLAAHPDAPGPTSYDGTLAHDEMWTAVSALPPWQRAVLVLRCYEDLSEQQIADVLGCRPRDYSSAVWADGRLVVFGGASYSGQRLLSASYHAWISTPLPATRVTLPGQRWHFPGVATAEECQRRR